MMRTDPRPDKVRGIVERVFAGYLQQQPRGREGLFPRMFRPREDDADVDECKIDETILIDRGRHIAREYRVEGYLAMWLVAVGIVQFYNARGRMLTTVRLFESLRPQRMAA